MNCGMPTESAASCPRASRMVALRSFDWFRIGVVAVRLTCVAISEERVWNARRMVSLVPGSVVFPPRALRGAPAPLASRDRTERSVFAGILLGYTQPRRADKDQSELRDRRSISRA